MRIRIFLITMLACISVTATGENYIVNQAYEIAVSDLRLPGTIVGTVSFRKCPTCETQTVSVTAETRYVLNQQNVPLDEFKDAVGTIANRQRNIATVIHHLESDTVVAVHVVM